jgi:YfiH family protein
MAINTLKNGTMEYLVAEGIGVPHCFTTRLGGVSTGTLESLNIGMHRGDTEENVAENYGILGKTIGFDPKNLVLTWQIHTDVVRRVTKADHTGFDHRGYPQCDGLITNDPGTALVVFTADCTPILFHDPVSGAVGACHAGWRGTAADIAGKTVAAMCREFGCMPGNLHAAIGPNLGACCFETDADVPEAMAETFGPAVWEYIRPIGNKFYVNLKAINALALRRAGVNHIEISTDCTRCNPHKYWSHRFHGPTRGSQGAIILCKEAKV